MSFDRQGFRLTTLNTTSDIVASSCLSSVKTHIWIAIFYTIDYYCDSLWTRCSCLLHFIYFFLPLSEISFSFLSPPEFERSTRDVFVQNCTHVVCWRLDCCHQGNNNPWYAYIFREKIIFNNTAIGHFPIVFLVAKPSIWSEAEQVTLLWQRPVSSEHDNKVFHIWKVATLVS